MSTTRIWLSRPPITPAPTPAEPETPAVIHVAGNDALCARCRAPLAPEDGSFTYERGTFVVMRGSVVLDAHRSKSSTRLAIRHRARLCAVR